MLPLLSITNSKLAGAGSALAVERAHSSPMPESPPAPAPFTTMEVPPVVALAPPDCAELPALPPLVLLSPPKVSPGSGSGVPLQPAAVQKTANAADRRCLGLGKTILGELENGHLHSPLNARTQG